MKKAKLMLSGLAILAVVGTTLAFSARSSQKIFCEDPSTNQCTVEVLGITTTVNLNPISNPCPNTKYGVTSTTARCPKNTVQFYQTAN